MKLATKQSAGTWPANTADESCFADTQLTCDSLWNGRVILWQPARGHGYRFNLDPVLLAAFLPPRDDDAEPYHLLDLGAGVGTIGILALLAGKATRVTAVERQPQLAALARRNAAANGVSERFTVVEGDLRYLNLPVNERPPVNHVVFNPPYFAANHGRRAEDPCSDAARHERFGTLEDFVRAARRSSQNATCSVIVRRERCHELQQLAHSQGFASMRQLPLCPRPGKTAKHVLWHGVTQDDLATDAHPGDSNAQTLPPLAIHPEGDSRDFTPLVAAIVSGDSTQI